MKGERLKGSLKVESLETCAFTLNIGEHLSLTISLESTPLDLDFATLNTSPYLAYLYIAHYQDQLRLYKDISCSLYSRDTYRTHRPGI